jgi:hypothetical protein
MDKPVIESLLLKSEDLVKMLALQGPKEAVPDTLKPVPYSADVSSMRGQFQYVDVNGWATNNQIRFACGTKYFSRLMFNNVPLSAKSLAYFFSGIQWSAGRGWPIYSTRCPRADSIPGATYPNARAHAIVLQFGGYYWPGCSNSEVGSGNSITDVFVGVNDDKYDDNDGLFELVVTGVGQ